jgi:hypothetical protein
MSLTRFLAIAVVIAGSALVTLPATQAANDDPTPQQITAGIAAFKAAGLGDVFDKVLPLLSEQIQNRLIQQRPDLTKEINAVVEGVAFKLIPRRKELDTAAGKIWAKTFTLEELQQITAFFRTEAGQKYLSTGQTAVQDSMTTMRSWSQRVADEMHAASREELKKQGIDF